MSGRKKTCLKENSDRLPGGAVCIQHHPGRPPSQAEALNDKRRRAIKRLLTELKEPTVEAVENYFAAFAERAPKFYFGENDRGWRASFDYLLRSDTLLKTREKAL